MPSSGPNESPDDEARSLSLIDVEVFDAIDGVGEVSRAWRVERASICVAIGCSASA